jgi:hypothetical protein
MVNEINVVFAYSAGLETAPHYPRYSEGLLYKYLEMHTGYEQCLANSLSGPSHKEVPYEQPSPRAICLLKLHVTTRDK